MVSFTFSFLLATPFVQVAETVRKPKKAKKTAKRAVLQETEIEKNYTETEVKKITFSCHVDYVLFPNQAPKSIDIVCWGNVAKIYYEGLTKSITPLVIEQISWIHFRVKHTMDIPDEDVPKFHEHVVTFTVSSDRKKLSQKAKSDKVKLFYGPKFDGTTDVQKQLFQPLTEELDLLYEVSKITEWQDQFNTNLECGPHASVLKGVIFDLTREYHNGSKRIPTVMDDEDEYPKFIMLKEPPKVETVSSKKKGTKGGKEKAKKDKDKEKEKAKVKVKGKGKGPGKKKEIQYIIPGELFLSGLNDFEKCLKYTEEQLPYFYCIARVSDILSKDQAERFNPFSVTISHLQDLPAKELRKCGIHWITFQYDVCGEIGVETKILNLKPAMKLNYTRTILTSTIDTLSFVQYLQTGGLEIEVFGILENTEQKPEPRLYNSEPISNQGFSSTVPATPYMVPLGVAKIDISSLLYEPHRILVKYNFHRPSNNIVETKAPDRFFQKMSNINEINNFYTLRKDLGYCHFMTTSSTVMTVSVRLGYTLVKMLKTVEALKTNTWNKLLMILYDFQVAVEILEVVQTEVKELISPVDYFKNRTQIKRPISIRNSPRKTINRKKEFDQVIGFLIDCVDKVIIYVESCSVGLIQHLWMRVSTIDPNRGRILYDSSLIFLKSPEQQPQYEGFYAIALRESPCVTLRKPRAYVRENIPIPAWKALMNLDQLSKCMSIKTACRENLLPDLHCLYSMDIEFGVPLKLRERYSGERA